MRVPETQPPYDPQILKSPPSDVQPDTLGASSEQPPPLLWKPERLKEKEKRRQTEEELARQIRETPKKYHAELTAELDGRGVSLMIPYRAKYTFIDSGGYLTKKDAAVSRSRDGAVRAVFDGVKISKLREDVKERSAHISGEDIDRYFDQRADNGRMVIEITDEGTKVILEKRDTGTVTYSENCRLDAGLAAHFIPKLEEFVLARPKNPGKPPSRGSADSRMVYQRRGNGSLADFEEEKQRRREARKLELQVAVASAKESFNSARRQGWNNEMKLAKERLKNAEEALEEFNHPKQPL